LVEISIKIARSATELYTLLTWIPNCQLIVKGKENGKRPRERAEICPYIKIGERVIYGIINTIMLDAETPPLLEVPRMVRPLL
jgi:hypothetical protein